MNRTPEQWALVNPRAVASGSAAQAENVLAMALQDIATLAAELAATKKPQAPPSTPAAEH